jgi:serine protease Do
MKKHNVFFSILVVLGLVVLTACGTVAGVTQSLATPSSSATATPIAIAPAQAAIPSTGTGASSDLLSAYQGTLEQIYTVVSPSVVNIHVVEQVASSNSGGLQIPGFPFFNSPRGQQQQPQVQNALGSGFVWDQNGDIVTNNHVVAGANKIEVTFSDGTTVPAKLVGTDPDSDLAVVKVDVPAAQLHPVQMGDSHAVKVGELAIAIGNPFGLEGSMSTGIVSAVGRSLPANETAVRSYTIPDIIQTDAPINPGNSGGVLIDMQGQVIGVTSAIESSSNSNSGVGFAIPSAIVKNVIPALIQNGKYVHAWLGISGTTLTLDLANAMKLSTNQRGALVEDVSPNSPAEKAGLRGSSQQVAIDGENVNVGGDIITAIDNQPILQMGDLIAYLESSTKVGQKVTLTILRDGKQQTLDVTLEARPTAQQQQSNANPPAIAGGIRLGIAGITVDQSIDKAMNLPNGTQGVLVEQVEQGSLADMAGLQAGTQSITINGQQVLVGGDIITAVNGQSIASVQDLRAALAQLPSNQSFTLSVLRNGQETQITIQSGQ